MPEQLAVVVAVHHAYKPWVARRDFLLSPDQLTESALPATLSLQADMLHDGGAIFGVPSPLIRLEARGDELPTGWNWSPDDLPALPQARPWQQPGWFAGAWKRLKAVQPSGPFRLLSTNDLCAVLVAGEGKERVFLKASAGQETRVTAALARSHAGLLPQVVSADLEQNELCTRYGGQRLDTVTDERAWTQAVEQLARYHRSATVITGPHVAFSDVLDRGTALLKDRQALRSWGLSDPQIQALGDALPKVRQLWNRVDALQVPDGPVHGDIHPMNALWDGEQARLFDWSEAAVAHPLTDIGWFIGHCAGQRWPLVQSSPALAQRLADTYLEALGLPGAQAELAAAVPLTLLQRAVVYDATFREWSVPRPQYVPYYLRRMLSQLKQPSLSPG